MSEPLDKDAKDIQREIDELEDDENFDDLPRTGQCGCDE